MLDIEAMRKDAEAKFSTPELEEGATVTEADIAAWRAQLPGWTDAKARCPAHVLALIGEVERLRAEVSAFRSAARIWVVEYEQEWGSGLPLSLAEADALVDADLAPEARERAMAVLRQNGLLGEGWGAPDE